MAILDRSFYTVDPVLDLVDGIGQRAVSYRFDLVDGVTGEKLRELHPYFGANLRHDTGLTVKRRLTMALGTEDTAAVDVVNNRVDPFMVMADGTEYPFGRYVFTADPRELFTSGDEANVSLVDEMLIVDQPLSFSVNGTGVTADQVVAQVMESFPQVTYEVASSEYLLNQTWPAGSGGGQILQSAALNGDYFAPWFDNHRRMRMVRSFDPGTAVPTIDLDSGNRVFQEGIVQTSDILQAPNRFIAISNSSVSLDFPVVGVADIAESAPHSFRNRGFYVVSVNDIQARDTRTAQAVANNLARRQTVFEYVELSTAADPRHDSYDVITWQGEKWLELSWSLEMTPGGQMTHFMRKAYS